MERGLRLLISWSHTMKREIFLATLAASLVAAACLLAFADMAVASGTSAVARTASRQS